LKTSAFFSLQWKYSAPAEEDCRDTRKGLKQENKIKKIGG
jgi:hypothetical protein